jgi:hypothetical protein
MPFLKRRNLVLVYDPSLHGIADFRAIAERIAARAPDVRPFVVLPDARAARDLPVETWRDPALTVAFGPSKGFQPLRGPVIACRPISKLDQYARFLPHSIDTPRTALFRFGMALPEEDWGDFVVLKPADLTLTSHGDFIQLMRARHAAALRPQDLPANHPAHSGGALVQSFIDSGENPCRTRILTLFGEPLYTQNAVLLKKRPALDAPDETLAAAVIATNATAASGRDDRRLMPDGSPDMLAFGRRIAAAFPEIPLLGIDAIRRAADGRLFALEVNAGGNTWHFSSPTWAKARATYPTVAADMYGQFGALDVAARVLADAARRHAR